MTGGAPPAGPEEQGTGVQRVVLAIVLCVCAVLLVLAGALDLTWQRQAVVGISVVLLAMVMNRSSTSYLVTLTLMLLSCFSTVRYGYWRFATARRFFRAPGANWTGLDVFFVAVLLFAESYAFLNLFLGYLQTLWPLRRAPVPLPEDPDLWPAVDLLIPTYNEPLSVVKYTALAAMNIDWPADRLNVVLLDDGRREEFRSFCQQAGIGYMTRDTNRHAKAGNINRALEQLHAPFVAIFDSDHVPTRSFLQITMGWFGRDPKLAMLQTPHHLYSPDPFERNLHQFRVIPNEGELFYGVVQDGNDFWNATFFCGSCAVMRRSALDEVGGIAVETVTEDAHTSLRLQMKGWNTAYINIPQAAGLATERLSGHVKQRIRWARGMVQVLRIENPLFARGLTAAQRLCYFNAMSHFLYALPRLIFLTAPLIYLIFGHVNVPGFWAAIVAYALPHLLLSNLANSRIQGQHRHSFWNEIYETVLAPYIFLPTMLALIHPKLGRFSVTAKGGVVHRSFFDTRIATPFLLLLGMNLLGLLCAVPRLVAFPHLHSTIPLLEFALNVPANLYDSMHQGTVWMNVFWTLFNLTVLSVATAVARESQQRRETVRVSMTVPASVVLPDGTLLQGVTTDVSSGGVMLRGETPMAARPNEAVTLIFPVLDGEALLPATVISVEGNVLRAHFDRLTLQEEEALTMVLYSRADTWLGWGEAREPDRPLVSFLRILQLAAHGFWGTARDLFVAPRKRRTFAGVGHSLFLLTVFSGVLCGTRGLAQNASGPAAPGLLQGQFKTVLTLRDARVQQAIVLQGRASRGVVHFAIPQTELVQKASMRLDYALSPTNAGASGLRVSLNGAVVATVPLSQGAGSEDNAAEQARSSSSPVVSREAGAVLSAMLPLPAELLVHGNELSFELVNGAGPYCGGGMSASGIAPWVRIAATSTIELSGSVLPIENNLKILPLPFVDAGEISLGAVPVVFYGERSPKVLAAAGIVASWLGIVADDQALRVPVSFGVLPPGNIIVLSADARTLPSALSLAGTSGPTIALRSHPGDPYTKVLILTGGNEDELLVAARALALQRKQLTGDTVQVTLESPYTPRRADDAPRWLATDRVTQFGEIPGHGPLETDGTVPVSISLRLPPDLYAGTVEAFPLHLAYRADASSAAPSDTGGTFDFSFNGRPLTAAPLPLARSSVQNALLPIPAPELRPYRNVLEGQLDLVSSAAVPCRGATPDYPTAALLKQSSIDLRGASHWAQLPNLELFADAGYPFTRLADLAGTAVVLPDVPSAEIVELYLTLMGRFGAETGVPGVSISVTNAAGMDGSKDYLVLGDVGNMPALRTLRGKLPLVVDGSGIRLKNTSALTRLSWLPIWSLWHLASGRGADLRLRGELPQALMEGIRWKQHSVILIALRNKAEVNAFLPAFLQLAKTREISRSVSVLSDGHFVSYSLGGDAYYVGTLSWWGRMNWFFAEVPWLLVPAVAVVCLLGAATLRMVLRRRARRRMLSLA